MSSVVAMTAPSAEPDYRAERTWRRLALWAALLPVLWAILALGAVDVWANGVAELGLYLGTMWVFVHAFRHHHRLPWHWTLAPLLGMTGLITAQWAFHWSRYPAATLDGLCDMAAVLCVYYLGVIAFGDPASYRWTGWVLWWFTAAVALEAIAQFYTARGFIYWVRDASFDAIPVGPFTYHNYYAAFCELLLPLVVVVSLGGLRRSRDWTEQLLWALVPALVIASFVVAASRGGLAGLAVELFLGVVVAGVRARRGGRRLGRATLAGGLLLCLALTALAGWGTLLHRLTTLTTNEPSVADRWRLALSCLHIWQHYPWLGSGLGTFATVYPAFRLFDNGMLFLQAHNDAMQLLAETGAVGALLTFAFLALLGAGGWRSLRSTTSATVRDLKLAALIGGVGFLVHTCGDFVAHAPSNLLLFFFLAALGAAPVKADLHPRGRDARRVRSSRRRVPRPRLQTGHPV